MTENGEPELEEEGAPAAPAPGLCPRCSSPVEPLQEYCLDCGLRLPRTEPGVLERAGADLAVRHPWSAGWLVSALLSLAIAALGTGAAIAISGEGTAPEAVPTATGGSRTLTEATVTLTAPEPTVTEPTVTAPTTAPPPATTAPPPTTTAPPATTAWPVDRRGWTIVLISIPQGAEGRPLAEQRAAEARRSGLQDVGVLNSSRFASLHPGYFVVFSGVFDSEAEATSALPRARSAFPLAYSRRVVP